MTHTHTNNTHKNNTVYPEVGVLEWFHINDCEHVEKAVEAMKNLGVRHLRTGVSWADYFTEDGEKWYDWLIPYLSDHFTMLPCFLYTPPSIGIKPKACSPPQNPKDYADFIDTFLKRHGDHFEYVELWNEPNNQSEYDYLLDESWDIFVQMIRMASYWARQLGKKTVLGGMSPIDPNWLKFIASKGALEYIDVVGIHGFPDVFDVHWEGWDVKINMLHDILNDLNLNREIWITETGYSTWRYDEQKQIENFSKAVNAPVDRVYWYSLYDLPRTIATVDGLYNDEREYHFGLIHDDNTPKLLYRLWQKEGILSINDNRWIYQGTGTRKNDRDNHVLVTGGAGFIGTNLAHSLMNEGYQVTVLDNLSRPGVENNLQWLRKQHPSLLNPFVADVRDLFSVEKAIGQVSHVFHFAAQVAVTTSLINPVHDHQVNMNGTINVLEAIRNSSHKPSLIFTSTNKVYGDLGSLEVKKNGSSYHPANPEIRKTGIGEDFHLDFHSPYGSSKGAADQYVLDYTRSFDLRNVVFRMSCIYGPHQFGTEDQGWVAHFILKALHDDQITLFGDGMQVRDILYVDDLVRAFKLAWSNIDRLKGEAFNIGGGPSNAISLLNLINMLKDIKGEEIPLSMKEWRKGDQKYYVSDVTKFSRATGWKPEVSYSEGVENLYNWLKKYYTPAIRQTKKQKSLIN